MPRKDSVPIYSTKACQRAKSVIRTCFFFYFVQVWYYRTQRVYGCYIMIYQCLYLMIIHNKLLNISVNDTWYDPGLFQLYLLNIIRIITSSIVIYGLTISIHRSCYSQCGVSGNHSGVCTETTREVLLQIRALLAWMTTWHKFTNDVRLGASN